MNHKINNITIEAIKIIYEIEKLFRLERLE